MPKKVQILVNVTIPDHELKLGATANKVMDYIRDALRTDCKSLRPPGSYDDEDNGDPLFYFSDWPYTVRYLSERERRALDLVGAHKPKVTSVYE